MKFEYKIINLSNINNHDSHDLNIYENKNKQNSQQLEKAYTNKLTHLVKMAGNLFLFIITNATSRGLYKWVKQIQ